MAEAQSRNHEPMRVDQTVIGAAGNCQSACLAMLLGLPLSEVPNFLELPRAVDDDEVSFKAQQAWLTARGWGLVTIQARGPFFKRHFAKGYVLVGGKSARDLPHAVIYKDGELWHDPHPDRGGVVEINEVDILYPLAPFTCMRSENERTEDPGTLKMMTALVERAYGIFTSSGVLRVAEQDPDSNDPIIAWASDVRSVLYRSKPAPIDATLRAVNRKEKP